MKKSRNNDLQNTTQKTNDRAKDKWLERVLRKCKQFFLYMYTRRVTFLTNPLINTENKGNNKITELRTILQRESQNS